MTCPAQGVSLISQRDSTGLCTLDTLRSRLVRPCVILRKSLRVKPTGSSIALGIYVIGPGTAQKNLKHTVNRPITLQDALGEVLANYPR